MWRRYACVRQSDKADCGAAALATIALHYRKAVGLQQLRGLAGTDRSGTNLFGLQQAARKLGFAARTVRATPAALEHVPLPAIAHVLAPDRLGHFVVVHRLGRREVVVADPSAGLRRMTRDDFESMWTGVLTLITPDPTATPAAEVNISVSPQRRFARLLIAHRGVLLEALCCAVLMTLLGVSTSYFIQHLVDTVLVQRDFSLLNALGLGMAVILVFRTLFSALRQYLLAYIGRKIDLALISRFSQHVLRLPQSFFETRQVGEILSRVNDAAKIREAVGGATLAIVVDGVLVLFTTTILWCYDAPLAFVATIFSPLLLAAVLAFHPAARAKSRRAMEDGGQLSATLVENIAGVETFKAFGAQQIRSEEAESRLARLAKSVFGLQMLNLGMATAGGVVNGLAGLVTLWFGGRRVIQGELTIGELMFFYTMLGYMLDPLERLASVNMQIQDALIAVDRLHQILDVKIEDADERKAALTGIERSIEIDGVSFRYGYRENVLDGLDLSIPAGSTVAIVGESGCGKSTLLKLLMRLYDPSEGRLAIDGVDLRDIDLQSLRSRIGMVSQDAFIFNGTVRENISLGAPEASLNDVIAAARSAGLDEFIGGLPDRYETMLGERGANLSGGQRQRLAIARALIKCPDLLIFDEATSHLDTTTEQAIQRNLNTVFVEKTVVLVAHRLSTIREADVICVMHEGRIVEQGAHADLMARNGRYAAMWRSQVEEHGRYSSASAVALGVNGNGRHRLLECSVGE